MARVRIASDDIALVGRAVRRLGADRTIVNEMTKEIRRAGTKTVKPAVRASALAVLPRRGGLNRWVAAAAVRVAVRRGTRAAGVEVVVGRNSRGGRTDSKRIDAGRVRAPAWGNRRAWHLQAVTPGFATDPITGPAADDFREGVVRAVDRAVERLL